MFMIIKIIYYVNYFPCWFASSFPVRCVAKSCIQLTSSHRVLARGVLLMPWVVTEPAVRACVAFFKLIPICPAICIWVTPVRSRSGIVGAVSVAASSSIGSLASARSFSVAIVVAGRSEGFLQLLCQSCIGGCEFGHSTD